MNDRDRLISLLKELFRFDKAELDFGIYRIMNQKKDEIKNFIEKDLVQIIDEEMDQLVSKDKELLEEKIEIIKNEAEDLGVNYKESKKYQRVKEELDSLSSSTNVETNIYNDIYRFFKRYYDNGDFLSKRRYSKDEKYAIPYNGEEVHLHWANNDQYYVKTTEEFDNYSFKKNWVTVNFKVVQAEEGKNNNKSDEDQYFLLKDENYFDYDSKNKEVNIYFEYRSLTKKENKRYSNRNTQADIRDKIFDKLENKIKSQTKDIYDLGWLINADKKANPPLKSHLYKYTTKNKSDYFIHKDLKEFLNRELDFFIKNEIMDIDAIGTEDEKSVETYLNKVRVIKSVSKKIIEFLAQIEDFQKKLFEKKKFVIDDEYCLTLDKVPQKIKDEIFEKILNNKTQLKEWEELFEEKVKTKNDLYRNNKLKNLVIDTKHFDEKFKENLISNYENIDKAIEGLMINSENYQGLNLIKSKQKNDIDMIYIDPPYNTSGHSEIMYKNDYKDSSWLTLMENRLNESKHLMKNNCVYVIAIDDFEMVNLSKLADQIFRKHDRYTVIVNHHPQGSGGDNISRTHEYALFLVPRNNDILKGKKIGEEIEERPYMRSGTAENNFRYGRPKSFYAILVDPETYEVVGIENPPEIEEDYKTTETKEGYKRVYPLGGDGSERVWRNTYLTGKELINNNKLISSKNFTIYKIIDHPARRTPLFSNWTDKRYNAGTQGTNMIVNLFNDRVFSYPKSLYTVKDSIESVTYDNKNSFILDYFAGSGTTAHAVLKLNQEDEGNRKYILMEMGHYFKRVTKLRIKKIMYSKEWENGKPINNIGYNHIFKYQKLEQYEDALENIKFESNNLRLINDYDDYLIKYMLDYETKSSVLNIDKFDDPFNYKITVKENKEIINKKVNLIETFNYLIGLKVKTFDVYNQFNRKYKVISGKKDEESILVIWRKTISLDLKDDKDFIENNLNIDDYKKVYINGDNYVEKSLLIEENFKKLMLND
jgi:adenine-specific DNA-methyltransferase